LSVQERLITVKADRVRDMLVILIENNTTQVGDGQRQILSDNARKNKTTKEDTFAHVFGISNIRNAVQKYAGQCSVRDEQGKFTLKIVIPMP